MSGDASAQQGDNGATAQLEQQLASERAAASREQKRHRMAMQVSKIGTWTADLRSDAVQWSPELAELFGLPPEEAPRNRTTFLELVHPDDRQRFREVVADAIARKEDYAFDFRYRHASGEYRWMTGRGRGFYDENGEPLESAGVGIDITEEQRAREIAQERASLLRQIGDNLPDGALYQVLAELDGGRRFIHWSAGIERLIGVAPEEAIANPGALYGLIHPDDAARLNPAEERSIADLSTFDEVVRIRHRQTGEWRWVHLRSAPRRLADGRVIWDGIYLDVTKQKEIEDALIRSLERLDLAQQAGHIGVFDWDVQTGRLVWTEEEQRLFGLPPGSFEGNIEAWAARVLPEDAERMQTELREAMERRDAQLSFAYRITTPAGAVRLIEGGGRFSYAPDGTPLRMVGVNIDVTEQREAERAVRAADRRKGEFLAMLSHELRNPLAAISNALELASSKTLDPATWEWSRLVMRRQMTHLTRLVDDLLDVTRITSGKIQLHLRAIDAADVLDSASSSLRLLFAQRAQELIPSYTRGSLFVKVDPTRLEQIIVNLLTNAAKYTPRGGKIWVHGGREAEHVVISVRDNGVGIAPEVLNDMFEIFAQGQRSIARSEGGLGLGLPIARTLVEMHGGEIIARSAGEGRGSEFVVRLPVTEAPTVAEAATPAHGLQASGRASAARILVVDDHVDTALSLARLLRARQNIVEVAHEGNGA
ncbi:MAG TPA: PAS domain-containing protein, partial [Chthoniobacterales bacterium]